jgi:hypothetical protein
VNCGVKELRVLCVSTLLLTGPGTKKVLTVLRALHVYTPLRGRGWASRPMSQ